MTKPLQKHYPTSDQVSAFDLKVMQDNIERWASQLSGIPFLSGNLIADVECTSGTAVEVTHKLGKKPVGFVVTRFSDATATTYGFIERDSSEKTITLYPVATGVFSIWVF